MTFPHIDASRQDSLTSDQVEFFKDNGLLVIRNLIAPAELALLQSETRTLVDRAVAGDEDPDFAYKEHELTGTRVPFRVEYPVDKLPSCKVLAGHPFVLRSVEMLQGRNFIPTWDSMVFKNAGAGTGIPWHRDSGDGCGASKRDRPIFNVDIYLDASDRSNCVWGIPGSNRWAQERADETIARLNSGGFSTEGATPIEMQPGDCLFHNILALHGSAPAQSHLRRVIYYEYRPGETEREFGPHTLGYIPEKQRVLAACLRHRAAAPYARGERPFVYRPDADFTAPTLAAGEWPATYRYPHGQFWRPPAATIAATA
ncbi:MAG: phytanoyl-CoA dioxygenase family protein [Planctomycetes bacterium]|nr:phytanoyl-CoA dioxygenase family protein [Planctomycetota bacterium]